MQLQSIVIISESLSEFIPVGENRAGYWDEAKWNGHDHSRILFSDIVFAGVELRTSDQIRTQIRLTCTLMCKCTTSTNTTKGTTSTNVILVHSGNFSW